MGSVRICTAWKASLLIGHWNIDPKGRPLARRGCGQERSSVTEGEQKERRAGLRETEMGQGSKLIYLCGDMHMCGGQRTTLGRSHLAKAGSRLFLMVCCILQVS